MAKKQKAPSDPSPTEAILESISDGVFTVDNEWRVTSFNRAAEEITGIPREEALGRLCSEVLRSSLCADDCPLRDTISSGKPLINKPCFIISADGERIPISVSTAVLRDEKGDVIGGAETFRDLSEVEDLRSQLEGRFHIGDMISRSPSMRIVFEQVEAVAASDCTVLVQGETGTGKELLARAIHGMGARRKGPFVAINCGALPDSLLESELFGYRKGAFTGADRDKPGRFALAEGGTLMLDEIAEVSPAMQVRLLRVLQEQTYEPLGATRSVKSDVRIIAASNRNLGEMTRAGEFREDLYYRVNVVCIELPPLRRRKEDIPLLVEHFISAFKRKQRRVMDGISDEALSLLMMHEWPGNIRELENVIERAFVLCTGDEINTTHLPRELSGQTMAGSKAGDVTGEKTSDIASLKRVTERQAIQRALEANGGNRQAAARELGMHKTTLYRKLKALGIELPDRDGRHRSDPET